MGTETIIGYLIVEEEHIAIEQFEVAAWYTSHCIAPGRYPVYAVDGTGIYGCPVTKCVFSTTIEDEDHTPLFGGVPIAHYSSDRIGTDSEYVVLFGYYNYTSQDGGIPGDMYNLRWATFEPAAQPE